MQLRKETTNQQFQLSMTQKMKWLTWDLEISNVYGHLGDFPVWEKYGKFKSNSALRKVFVGQPAAALDKYVATFDAVILLFNSE